VRKGVVKQNVNAVNKLTKLLQPRPPIALVLPMSSTMPAVLQCWWVSLIVITRIVQSACINVCHASSFSKSKQLDEL